MWTWALLAASALTTFAQGGYVITTTQQWTYGTGNKVCTFHVGTTGQADEYLKITVENSDNITVASATLPVAEGQKTGCQTVQLPELTRTSSPFLFGGSITFAGRLDGKNIFRKLSFNLDRERSEIFLHTDKYLYLPGQTVRFRLLTVRGPNARVSTENYRIVYVETPSGTRIRQWRNVNNARGIVQLEFQLNQEADEGSYSITAEFNRNEQGFQQFSVQDYVPPKFEVTVTPPNDLLSTDIGGSVRVCASYTFGRPVKGRAVVTFGYERTFFSLPLSDSPPVVTKESPIKGCQDFAFTLKELSSDDELGALFGVPVSVSVFEEGTDTEIKSQDFISIRRRVLTFYEGDFRDSRRFRSFGQRSVKPGLPFTVKVTVRKVPDEKASFEPLRVCLKNLCKVFKTDSEGVLGFHVPQNAFGPDLKHFENFINITALNYPEIKKERGNTTVYIRFASNYMIHFSRYFSPTKSSLLINVPEGELDCREEGHQLYLDVLFSAFRQEKATITVQVISRGEIRYHHTAEYALRSSPLPLQYEFLTPMENPEGLVVGLLKIPISLRQMDSPEARVLVWYSRDDGEVVSDVAEVNIQQCLRNQVRMAWGPDKVEPRGRSTLTIAAEPNSICGYGVVDKSVELLSSQQFGRRFDPESIFAFINSQSSFFGFGQSNTEDYCAMQPGPLPPLPTERPPVILEDDGFQGKYTIPLPPRVFLRTVHKDAIDPFEESGLFVITDLTLETRPCFREEILQRPRPPVRSGHDLRLFGGPEGGSPPAGGHGGPAFAAGGFSGTGGSSQQEATRTYFPETWLWDLTVIPSSGQSSGDFTLPDTVTEWVGKAVCVHPNKGVGISNQTSIVTFTPFFAEITLPASVKRGEILPVKISVFNYLRQNLPVKVVLESSPSFDILGNGDVIVPVGERFSCVQSNDQETSIVRIRLKEIGNINMTARAFVDNSAPQQCGFQGTVTKRDALTKPLRVDAEGFPREKTWTKYVCAHELENNVDSLDIGRVDIPAGIVEGSERAFFTVTGDLLGPSYDNLDNLIRMPFGCGEQNLVLLVPNIYIMQYLEASQQITPEIAERSKRNMRRGYERQLKYRHPDGSYGAFESRGNIFPPGFGDFPEVSNSSEDSGSTWLTAFVVKSFSQARQYIFIDEEDLTRSIRWLENQQMNNGCFRSVGKVFSKALKGGIGTDVSDTPVTAYVVMAILEAGTSPSVPAVQRAITCLLQQHQTWSTYTRAIASYALALAGHPDARTVLLQLLQEAKRSSSSISWEIPAGLGRGVAVEIAGYAVLAMRTLDPVGFDEEAFKVVKWISTTRNGQGGFISTQDTVVALQALASYSSTIQQGGLDVVVTIGATNLQQSFQLNDQNRILQQIANLPTVPTSISLDMRGQGCALLQAVLRYNVPTPDPTDVFSLDVRTYTEADKTCITKGIQACTSYRLPDQESNMAILEIDLISGYVPNEDDFKSIIDGKTLLKKYEIDGSKVLFYFDELTTTRICVSFKVTREVDVDNVKAGTVRVYDYYQPEFTVERRYFLPRNDECIIIRNDTLPVPRPFF